MESKPMEHVHTEIAGCDEASQVVTKSLRVPLILREILRHLSNADLLTISNVNKLWLYEARSVMKERDSLTGSIKISDPRQNLTPFASLLGQMIVVPFSGLSFVLTLGESHVCEPPSNGEIHLDPSLRIILDRLQWKHLSVTLLGLLCRKCKEFPALLFLKTIFKDKCGILEELSLSIDSKSRGEFIREFLQGSSFPRLRVLKLGQLKRMSPSRKDAENIKALVSRTPKLQELRIPDCCVPFRENVLQGTSAVLLTNLIVIHYDQPYCSRDMVDVIRFEKVHLGVLAGHLDVRGLNSIIPDMLQRSRTTLKSLSLPSALAVPFMSYGISFDNLRKLQISQRVEHLEPRIMRLLNTFDFARIFPNLERVITGDFNCGCPFQDSISNIVDLGNGLWKEPLPKRAVKIKHLSISKVLNQSSAPFFAEMLPDVEVLSVDPIDPSIPFGLIWEDWADLKELHVRSQHWERPAYLNFISWIKFRIMPNLDSEFCGIFPEEVAELRKKNQEYLRMVNIVPVKPSISCLKDLRTFKFYCHFYCLQYYEGKLDPPEVTITQVSGLIAFARCPGLSVTLQTATIEDAEALRHMKPYATVVAAGPNVWPWNDMESEA